MYREGEKVLFGSVGSCGSWDEGSNDASLGKKHCSHEWLVSRLA